MLIREEDIHGKHAFIAPPTSNIFNVLEHYCEMKKKAPISTSACFLLPKWEHAAFQLLLNGCEVLQTYEARTHVPKTNTTLAAARFPMEVWYDSCKPAMQVQLIEDEDNQLMMTFAGKLGCHSAKILVDSGATHCFISPNFVKNKKLSIFPDEGEVSCAGGTVTAIQGYVKVPVRLQSFSGLVKFYIMDLPNTSGLNAILGQTWTKEYQANLDYASECVHFQKEGKSAKIFCSKPKKIEVNSTLLSMARGGQPARVDPLFNFVSFRNEVIAITTGAAFLGQKKKPGLKKSRDLASAQHSRGMLALALRSNALLV